MDRWNSQNCVSPNLCIAISHEVISTCAPKPSRFDFVPIILMRSQWPGDGYLVPQQNGRAVDIGEQQIHAAAIPEIGGKGGAAYIFFRQRGAGLLADLLEFPDL